jgi:hypothetical protein
MTLKPSPVRNGTDPTGSRKMATRQNVTASSYRRDYPHGKLVKLVGDGYCNPA